MKIDINKLNKYLIFILLVLYTLQGTFYDRGSIIAKVFITIILLFEFYYFTKAIRYYKVTVLNGILLLFILNLLYFLFSEKTVTVPAYVTIGLNSIDTWPDFKNLTFILFSFFVSFYLTLQRKLSDDNIVSFFYVFFVISIFNYIASALDLSSQGYDNFVNNASYNFIVLIPFIFYIKKRPLALFFLLLSFIFVMISAKRGAILIAFVSILHFLYFYYIKNNKKNILKNALIFLFILASIFLSVMYIYNNNDFLQLTFERTLEGDSSLRDYLYQQMFDYWSSSYNSLWNFIFGFGFLSSISITGLYAHNDWLELLTMSGLFGVVIYLILFIQIFKFIRIKYIDSKDRNIVISILIIWFLKTIFSIGYLDVKLINILFLLGYIVGKYYVMNKTINARNS